MVQNIDNGLFVVVLYIFFSLTYKNIKKFSILLFKLLIKRLN